MEEINIQDIMKQIRKEIKEQNLSDDLIDFETVEYKQISEYEKEIANFSHDINILNVIYAIPWKRPIKEKGFKGLVKKVVTYLASFLVGPISDDQNSFNGTVTRTFNELTNYLEYQNMQIEMLKKELEALKAKTDLSEGK